MSCSTFATKKAVMVPFVPCNLFRVTPKVDPESLPSKALPKVDLSKASSEYLEYMDQKLAQRYAAQQIADHGLGAHNPDGVVLVAPLGENPYGMVANPYLEDADRRLETLSHKVDAERAKLDAIATVFETSTTYLDELIHMVDSYNSGIFNEQKVMFVELIVKD